MDNNIDLTKIHWVKNVKRDGGKEWAYFEDYGKSDNTFPIHWSNKQRRNAEKPKKGDYIILYQNYRKQGVRLTHIVEVMDDTPFNDENNIDNFRTARLVKLIHRSRHLTNGGTFRFYFRSVAYGYVHPIALLDSKKKKSVIQAELFKIFYDDYVLSFHLNPFNGYRQVCFPPNKIYKRPQQIKNESKLLTLIGENGCGKSAILESIFNSSMHSENLRFICFSSGQNEIYSKILKENKEALVNKDVVNSIHYQDEDFDLPVKAFYFNKNWIRLLIFFARVFYPNGKVSQFLYSNNYLVDENGNDLILKLPNRLDWGYVQKVRFEREREESGHFSTFLQSKFHKKLSWFFENVIGQEYDFEAPVRKSIQSLTIQEALNIFPEKSSDLVFNFFWVGSDGVNKFFDLDEAELYLNNIELEDYSDGEFQLLAIYSLIDHFDGDNTIFVFDEIDSHLYYQNIEKLWNVLKALSGSVITTTHIADSIIQNSISDIALVKSGKLLREYSLNSTIERIRNLSGSKDYEFKISSSAENLVLIDDVNDWIAFKKLASIKCENYNEDLFKKIRVISVSSGADSEHEQFGNSKLNWVKEFLENNTKPVIKTKNIFLICDKDNRNVTFCQNGVQVTGNNKRKQFGNGGNAYLLSWARRQIENYYMSYSLAVKHNILDALNNTVLPPEQLKQDDPMDYNSVKTAEVKDILKVLYCDENAGLNSVTRNQILSDIPASEISEDIENMYNFIASKVN
jgi:ABC-type multidrug transport system ATPase subunit